MGEVEIFMYVGLGFATAALIALLIGRLLWTLAVGVGRRRAQRTAASPAVSELQAERNQLRAEYAMLARRVEVRLDDLKSQVAEHMAEVSRSRNRIDHLGAEIEMRDSEIARLKEHIVHLEAELATRTSSLHELQDEYGKGGEAKVALSQQLAERDLYIERLRAEVDRLSVARSEAVSRQRSVQERLMGRIEDLSALSRQIEQQRRELVAQQSQSLALRETAEQRQPEPDAGPVETDEESVSEQAKTEGVPLERRIEDAERQANELQSELDRLDQIWAAKLADVARAVAVEPATPGDGDEVVTPEPLSVPAGGSEAAAANGGASSRLTAPEDDKKTASGLANVISLAQRIRALQRNGS